ncbi:YybH family protein [Mesorhizobium sp. ASY16-5R]|uniref:YybH family protein n=1 Tax=Mesorhizobium sp. ASY16-5R TaxID=3445772 RepID=UPI003F9ED226
MKFHALAASFCLFALSAPSALADDAADIRSRLHNWAEDFNEGRTDAACGLFSKDLVSDTQGQGETNYETRCKLISRVMHDPARKFRYAADIKEVIVEGDLAIVRLQWTLTVSPGNEASTESGLDVFRKEADGVWRIIRFMAFQNE